MTEGWQSSDADILWLNAKTPANFFAKKDKRQAGLVAQRAQGYSRWRQEVKVRARLEDSQKNVWSTSAPATGSQQGVLVLRHSPRFDVGSGDREVAPSIHNFGSFQVDLPTRQDSQGPPESDIESCESAPSLSTYLQGGNTDPFNATPVPLTSWNYGVLTYIRPLTLVTVWPVEMANSRSKAIVSPAHKNVYKNYVSHPSLMHAMLAYSWSVMSILKPDQKEACHLNVTEHVVRSLRALRPLIASLQHQSDPAILICALQTVQTLTSAETYRGNREASMQHRKGIARIVQLIGGFRNVSWILRSAITYLLVRVAANTGSRTDVDPSDWDPGAWFPQHSPLVGSPSLPSSSASSWPVAMSISRADRIIYELFAGLRELVVVAELFKRSSKTMSETEFIGMMQWAHLRRQAIRGRIGNYWVDITEPDQAVAPQLSTFHMPTTVHFATVHMCVCLAMLIFIRYGLETPMVRAQHWIPSVQIHHLMLMRCVRKLGFELEAIDVCDPGVRDLLWVCAIGVQVEEEFNLWKRTGKRAPMWVERLDPDEFDTRWFSIRFGLLARRFGFDRFEDVVGFFMVEYVYVPEIYETVLRRAFELR